ncbi:MAG: antibiotic biosynthesis monooxygenase [Acidimicrobiia bacterium]
MHQLFVTTCQVQPGRMQELFTDVQNWEHAAMESADAPEYHAVYIRQTDPSHVLVITQFDDKERADAFVAAGHLQEFHEGILSCAVGEPQEERYELFYASGSGGPRVIFGEET